MQSAWGDLSVPGTDQTELLCRVRLEALRAVPGLAEGSLVLGMSVGEPMQFLPSTQLLHVPRAAGVLQLVGHDHSAFVRLSGSGGLGTSTLLFVSGVPTDRALDRVEALREGNDLHVKASIALHADRVAANNVLQTNYRGLLYVSFDDIAIPASLWSQTMLPALGHRAPRWIELPQSRLAVVEAAWPAVWSHLETARRELLDVRNLRAVGENCFKALEALAKGLGYSGWPVLADALGQQERREEKGRMVRAFASYLQPWRHDDTPKGGTTEEFPQVTYQEAAFVFTATAHLIAMALAESQ